MIHDAHAFRGEFIDLCAGVEAWAVDAARAAPNTGGTKIKLPYLFGQKLERAEQLAAESSVFAHPERVIELLAQLKPLTDLRGNLAHAQVTIVGEGDNRIYAFALPTELPDREGRFWIRPDEAKQLLTELKKVAKQLRDQRPRAT